MELSLQRKKIIVTSSLLVIVLTLIILPIKFFSSFLGANIGLFDQDNTQTFNGVLDTENFELGENVISFTATDDDGNVISAVKKFTVIDDPTIDVDEDVVKPEVSIDTSDTSLETELEEQSLEAESGDETPAVDLPEEPPVLESVGRLPEAESVVEEVILDNN